MSRIRVKITGDQTIVQALREAGARWERALGVGLYQSGVAMMTASKALVPVDSGTLKASGYVTLPSFTGDVLDVELGYGGPAYYAVLQHENLFFKHPNGGQAKYLEEPVNARRNNILRDVKNVAQEAFKGGQGAAVSDGMPTVPWNPEALARNAARTKRKGGEA